MLGCEDERPPSSLASKASPGCNVSFLLQHREDDVSGAPVPAAAADVPDAVRRESSMTFTVDGFSNFTRRAELRQQCAAPRRAKSVSFD
ncbi:hypothetical protein NL676_008436 [Syzygium grande]|nr:hypothetical protein NL676_008436 [Syzygium grande]